MTTSRLTTTQRGLGAEHQAERKRQLAAQNDPFRLDTPAGHRDGEWLAIA